MKRSTAATTTTTTTTTTATTTTLQSVVAAGRLDGLVDFLRAEVMEIVISASEHEEKSKYSTSHFNQK